MKLGAIAFLSNLGQTTGTRIHGLENEFLRLIQAIAVGQVRVVERTGRAGYRVAVGGAEVIILPDINTYPRAIKDVLSRL